MKEYTLGTRSVVFSYDLGVWQLNLHVILGEQFTYVIDTGLGAESVAPVLERIGHHNKPVVVINTHHHWDHVWGNHCFCQSPIIAHRACREVLAEEWDAELQRNHNFVRGAVEKCLPNLVFEDELYFPDDEIRLLYTPGHTRTDISVFDEKDKIVNVGDAIGDTPEELLPSLALHSDVYRSSLLRLSALGAETCVSGHNEIMEAGVFGTILGML